ncbi:growth hormone receptor b isoform X2 [Denticeps clupeoides]|uniref:Fibronectin type-III domain-containing protein n=1 Tax=Denticeps clupeoides TaxID=299321 RepID=A0AAY4B0W3_9TELE|nr:growth hormone receptor-like isoform X2 [Denticeps clupeoides]
MAAAQAFTMCLLFLVSDVAPQGLYPHFKENSEMPYLTGCISREMVTFRCSWSSGRFNNLTEPGDLRLFYMLEMINPNEWLECPSYSTLTQNECFFDKTNTLVWTAYGIQLRSRDQETIYDTQRFTVENIVHPDPPVGLNWTLLSVGASKKLCDVAVSWEPPPSALSSVAIGWVNMEYEVQHKESQLAEWHTLDLNNEAKKNIYGLLTNTDYKLRVRCKMHGFTYFSNFSESILIHVPATGPGVPLGVVFAFIIVGIGIIIILIIISRPQKLMVIFLPPIPGPKIRGLDPELLQKGKLIEVSTILGSHHNLQPEFYGDDTSVEFIELDFKEPSDSLGTPFLMDHSPACDSRHLSSSFRDDDSGRASCCDPDLPEPDASELRTPLPSPFSSAVISNLEPTATSPTDPSLQAVFPPPLGSSLWPGKDLYSQVIEITPVGTVVLSPQEQDQLEEAEGKQEKLIPKQESNVMMGNLNEGGYTSEWDSAKFQLAMEGGRSAPYQDPPGSSGFPATLLPTTPEYTMVDGADAQNSLLLRANSLVDTQVPQTKTMPSPGGYLTPDLLQNISF